MAAPPTQFAVGVAAHSTPGSEMLKRASGDAQAWPHSDAEQREGGAAARLSRLGLELAGWGYLILVFVIGADVVGRRVLGLSTAATTELGGYLLAIGISWGMAGTLVERAHIRIDVFVQRAPVEIRALFHVAALAVLTLAAAFICYASIRIAVDSWALGATDLSPLRTPLVVPQGIWAAGFVVFGCICLLRSGAALLNLMRGRFREVDLQCASKTYIEEAEETLTALSSVPSPLRAAPAPMPRSDLSGGSSK